MMRDYAGGCGTQIVAGHHQPIDLGRLGATREFRPLPRLAADDLLQACLQPAAVRLVVELKGTPNHRVANTVSSASSEA